FPHKVKEPQPVVCRDRDKAGRDFDDIKFELLAFDDVLTHRVATLGEYALDETAGRHEHLMLVAKINNLSNDMSRHESERAAGKFQRIDIVAHRFKQVFQVTSTDNGVIRPPDFR